MSDEDPFPTELIPDAGFGSPISHLCSRPALYVGGNDFSAVQDKIKKRSAEIAAQMEPGDELWEWDA